MSCRLLSSISLFIHLRLPVRVFRDFTKYESFRGSQKLHVDIELSSIKTAVLLL